VQQRLLGTQLSAISAHAIGAPIEGWMDGWMQLGTNKFNQPREIQLL
jgi:hypothetical protein